MVKPTIPKLLSDLMVAVIDIDACLPHAFHSINTIIEGLTCDIKEANSYFDLAYSANNDPDEQIKQVQFLRHKVNCINFALNVLSDLPKTSHRKNKISLSTNDRARISKVYSELDLSVNNWIASIKRKCESSSTEAD